MEKSIGKRQSKKNDLYQVKNRCCKNSEKGVAIFSALADNSVSRLFENDLTVIKKGSSE
jgi:hypothetical protein